MWKVEEGSRMFEGLGLEVGKSSRALVVPPLESVASRVEKIEEG